MITLTHLKTLAVALAVTSTITAPAQSADEPPSVSDQIDDATLTTRVKTALARDKGLNARAIRVETKDGIVQLSGFVPSTELQTQALETARAVQGVTEVRNDITVRDAQRSEGRAVEDRIIEARVKSSLDDARLGDKGEVNVEVSKGVVQLSGFVANLDEKNRAADAAAGVKGVLDVRNNIALAR